jgi:rhodanese-related sulfurtransferase
MQVAMFLERNGFDAVYNLMGGVEAWAGEVDPGMRRY